MENILSLLIWIPILGAILVAFLPRDKDNLIRYTSAAVTGLQFVIAIVLWKKFYQGVLDSEEFMGFRLGYERIYRYVKKRW